MGAGGMGVGKIDHRIAGGEEGIGIGEDGDAGLRGAARADGAAHQYGAHSLHLAGQELPHTAGDADNANAQCHGETLNPANEPT